AVVSGSSAALEGFESSFHQDLNGDGTIGPAPAAPTVSAVEAPGGTSLMQSSSNFHFSPVAAGSGPAQFAVWTTDSSGNHAGNSGAVSGISAVLTLAEAVFHQDLNADGTIGAAASHPADWHLHV
ncbi:protease, partial [Bradyrhizobium diazoefficiens]|nr:protease [Bradyrhizobium diazoefficiens]